MQQMRDILSFGPGHCRGGHVRDTAFRTGPSIARRRRPERGRRQHAAM